MIASGPGRSSCCWALPQGAFQNELSPKQIFRRVQRLSQAHASCRFGFIDSGDF